MRRSRGSSRGAARPLIGEIGVPGDKSISHRALILAALASGTSRVARPNTGEDVAATARMIEALGASCDLDRDKVQAYVEGNGPAGLAEPPEVLDAGNSGTSLRLMAGICAGIEGLSILTGDDSLRGRPMLRVVAPLRQMGARIDGRDHGNLAPLAIRGGSLTGVDIELPVASAQVKSALLLAGHLAAGTTTVTEPRLSRDHTERMMSALGLSLDRSQGGVAIDGGGGIEPFELVVPGDLSSAMFLIVAASIVEGSNLTITGVGLNPTRTAALDVLRSMGADIETEVERSELGEPVGTVRVRHSHLKGIEVPPAVAPALIDEIPALAIAASQAEGTTVFAEVGELRVKESDRIAAIAEGLRALSGRVDVSADGFAVRGPVALTDGVVDSRGDHRIAMGFAVAGLVATGKVRVERWSCVDTSFPEFLEVMGEATRAK